MSESETSPSDELSISDLSNALNAISITLCRIYDALMVITESLAPAQSDKLVDLHDSGFLLSQPWINENPFDLEKWKAATPPVDFSEGEM